MNTKRLFFQTLSPSQEKVLIALAKFKFLTTPQLLNLGVMANSDNLNKQISELRFWKNPLVATVKFWIHPKFWRLPSIHYLTIHGAKLLKEHFGTEISVRFPQKNATSFSDYFHRLSLIDIHMTLDERAFKKNIEILFFKTYFDKISTGRKKGFRAESAIPIYGNEYLIADAICMLQTPNRKELFAIEMYRWGDTNRVHKSLFHHLQALIEGQPSILFGLNHWSRVLCVFELENYKKMAIKRLMEDERFTENAKPHFLFKTLDELKQEVFEDWELFDGEKTSLF